MSYQPVTQKKQEDLKERMRLLNIREDDLIEKFIMSGGRGGQKVNKSKVCVYLKHKPSGIEVKCNQSRYRELNRFLARRRLCEKIDRLAKNMQQDKFVT